VPELSYIAAFLAGLLGGVHCVGMCGGIVAAMSFQPRPAGEGGERRPLVFHLAYKCRPARELHAGRRPGGPAGSAAFLSEHLLPLQQGLYLLAQVVMILLGFYLAGLSQTVLVLERLGGRVWRRLKPLLSGLLPIRNLGQALAAGALWGWLPCGLVYSVLVSALAAGDMGRGGALMLAFGLGTLPNLLLMGWAAESLRQWVRHEIGRASCRERVS
jgi:sulfite exporter TauE/SafE